MVGRSLVPAIVCVWALALAGAASSSHVSAQRESPIWEGVYNDIQAERGKNVFREHCAVCHEDDNGEAPKLDDANFMRHWGGHSLDRLLTKIRTSMPAGAVESVTPGQKVDALAYILQLNAFPPGEELLKDDPEKLAQIQIVPMGGLGPMPTGAMVQVVGCLTEMASGSAVLTNSTEPAPASLDPATPAELKASETAPPGTQTVRLLDLRSADARNGQRAEAKGLLIRKGSELTVNVVALRTLASSCP